MPEKINNAVYEETANTWWDDGGFLQGLKALNPGRFAYLKKILDEQGLASQGMTVVDVGCGGGYASEYMEKMGMQVVGGGPIQSHHPGRQKTCKARQARHRLPFGCWRSSTTACVLLKSI